MLVNDVKINDDFGYDFFHDLNLLEIGAIDVADVDYVVHREVFFDSQFFWSVLIYILLTHEDQEQLRDFLKAQFGAHILHFYKIKFSFHFNFIFRMVRMNIAVLLVVLLFDAGLDFSLADILLHMILRHHGAISNSHQRLKHDVAPLVREQDVVLEK